MKKFLFGFIALAVIATGVLFAFAQTADKVEKKEGRHGKGPHKTWARGHRGGGRGMGMAFRGLDLTDAQKAQVKEIMTASREKLKPAMESLKANHEKMESLTAAGTFDEAAVTALANEQAQISAQMIVERARIKSQMFTILTDEQKAKLAEMKAKRGERFKAFREKKAEKVSE